MSYQADNKLGGWVVVVIPGTQFGVVVEAKRWREQPPIPRPLDAVEVLARTETREEANALFDLWYASQEGL